MDSRVQYPYAKGSKDDRLNDKYFHFISSRIFLTFA